MKLKNKREFFIGIDLGWKEKKSTGICILEQRKGTLFPSELWCKECQVIIGGETLRKLSPFLKNTKVIAIDAPLTKGRGKGDMRLYEKFLSTKIFKEEKVSPIPPALMSKLCIFARELKRKLEKRGFVLDRPQNNNKVVLWGKNLIEVFPTLTKKLCNDYIFQKLFGKDSKHFFCQVEDQKSALLCASLAYLHFHFQTRYLGYKDGFLFLPEMSFWTKEWRQKFYQAWMARPRLKYHYLVTNIFEKK